MKKLLTTVIIAVFCLTFPSLSSARSGRSQAGASKASNTDCAAIKFHFLRRYRGQRWSSVFSDREVAPALSTLLKSNFGLLKESLQEVSYPENSLSYLDRNGVLTFEGGVPGLYTIMEAKLIIEPCGNIYAAILDNGERFLYFTNDRKYSANVPPGIEQWITRIESLRSQTREVTKLPVVFKNR